MKNQSGATEKELTLPQNDKWLKRIALGLAIVVGYTLSSSFASGLGAFMAIYLIGLTFGFLGSFLGKKELRTKSIIMHDGYIWIIILCLINLVTRYIL